MDEQRFREVLTSFADAPADVSLTKGVVLVQVQNNVLEAEISFRDGILMVAEAGSDYTAHRWIVERVARMPLLAERIASTLLEEKHFVAPTGALLDELDRAPLDEYVPIENVLTSVREIVDRPSPGAASVTYLTSDAGEGKTTIINTLAIEQARRFKARQAQCLIVPIELAGRPFLRLDDVVASALLNRFRFPLFYDAFLQLMRMRVIVPALDGFEEMFVEGAAGDAVTALGTLVSEMQSAGSVIVAARQAYFDYKSLDTQAKLYDSLVGQSVSFSCVKIHRWKRAQVSKYFELRGVPQPTAAYDRLVAHLHDDHSLLTRAVLVRHVVDLLLESGIDAVILQLERATDDHFGQVVRPLLTREARKWVDRSGEPYRPLLSEGEHGELLQAVALEMWLGETSSLSGELLEWVAELFCESRGKTTPIARQVAERIRQHALLVHVGQGSRGTHQFDHEEFFHYFLGRAIASLMVNTNVSELRRALRLKALPRLTVDIAGASLNGQGGVAAVAATLEEACRLEPSASFLRENAGAVMVRAVDGYKGEGVTLVGLVFPAQALNGRRCHGVTFRRCEFGETEVGAGDLTGAKFENCTFAVLDLLAADALRGAAWKENTVRAVIPAESRVATYDPAIITALLEAALASPNGSSLGRTVEVAEPDEALKHTERVIRRFIRSSEVNEGTIRQAAGTYANTFVKDVLPLLEREEIFVRVKYQGSGQQSRYRLRPQLEVVSEALKSSAGSFERFIQLVSRKSKAQSDSIGGAAQS